MTSPKPYCEKREEGRERREKRGERKEKREERRTLNIQPTTKKETKNKQNNFYGSRWFTWPDRVVRDPH